MSGTAGGEIARASSERGELVLSRRSDGALELRANGVFVMDTVETSTERELARAALAQCTGPSEVLVGGLGLGFTLDEVLADARVARCTVVEIEPALVDWLRDGTVPHGPALLDAPRVRVVVDDVAAVLRAADAASYDLVLLDVDNGPGYLVHDANAALYGTPFLGSIVPVVRPGGVLAIWAADRAPALLEAMTTAFDGVAAVEEQAHDVVLGTRKEQYWLYLARVASRA